MLGRSDQLAGVGALRVYGNKGEVVRKGSLTYHLLCLGVVAAEEQPVIRHLMAVEGADRVRARCWVRVGVGVRVGVRGAVQIGRAHV